MESWMALKTIGGVQGKIASGDTQMRKLLLHLSFRKSEIAIKR